MEKLNNNRIEEVQTPEDSNYPEAPNFDILTSDDTVKTPETLDHETLVNNVKEKFNTSRIKQEVFRTLCAFTSGVALSMLIFAQKDVQPLDERYLEVTEQTDEEINDEHGELSEAEEAKEQAEPEISEEQKHINEELERINKENDTKADEIIKELDLKESDDFLVQLQNCLKVQDYIVRTNVCYPDIFDELSDEPSKLFAPNVLHKALYEERGNSVSYCYEFQYILSKLNIKVARAILNMQDDTGNKEKYILNLVKLQDKYYYFDTMLEQSIQEMRASKEDHLGDSPVFLAAGLGSKTYKKVVESFSSKNYNTTSLSAAYFDINNDIGLPPSILNVSDDDLSLGTLIDLDSINRHIGE